MNKSRYSLNFPYHINYSLATELYAKKKKKNYVDKFKAIILTKQYFLLASNILVW